MDNLDNVFGHPNRRELLKWGAACGAVCAGGLRPCIAQDVAGTSELEGPRLKGIIRHPARHWEKLEDNKVKCLLCPRE